jgi:hypothetical protein
MGFVSQTRKRSPTKQNQSLIQLLDSASRIGLLQPSAFLEEPFKPIDIKGIGFELEDITAVGGRESLSVRVESLPEMGNMSLD